jgi:hypothetical protein
MTEEQAKSWREEAGMTPCWLVWENATDGGRPYLIAVDTSEEQANRHVLSRKETARVMDKPPPMLHVEKSWLDHLYGETMTMNFDEAKKMVRELQSAEIKKLRASLARAIELGQRAYRCSDLDNSQECLDELSELKGQTRGLT